MIYAEINSNNICFAIADMGNVICEKETLIPIKNYCEDVLGKRYNNGVWEEVEQPEPEPGEPQPTNADIMAEIKKTQSELIDEYTLELMERGVL